MGVSNWDTIDYMACGTEDHPAQHSDAIDEYVSKRWKYIKRMMAKATNAATFGNPEEAQNKVKEVKGLIAALTEELLYLKKYEREFPGSTSKLSKEDIGWAIQYMIYLESEEEIDEEIEKLALAV